MEDRDNVMLILKSIAPIKYTYSKKNKLLNKSKHPTLKFLGLKENYPSTLSNQLTVK